MPDSSEHAKNLWIAQTFGVPLAVLSRDGGSPAAEAPTSDSKPGSDRQDGDASQVGTKGATIRIVNGTGADLKLVSSQLQFKDTAKFAPPPPAVVPGRDGNLHTEGIFNVIETTVGSAKSGGTAQYHIERRITNSFFSFSWAGGDGILKVDGPYTTKFHGETDTENGDFYEFVLGEAPSKDIEDLRVRFDVFNKSGLDLSLVSVTLDDPQHTEFALKPASQIKNRLTKMCLVQALDKEHDKAGGTVIYRLDGADRPRTARMSWIKDGHAVGVMDPNDGAFLIKGEGSGQKFEFTVEAHSGPVPPTGGYSTITVVNKSGYEFNDMFTMLDGKSAKFKSEPAKSIANGGLAAFEVVSDDPHEPDTDGIVAYEFDINDEMQSKPFTVNMTWRTSAPSFSKIVPEKEGFSVDIAQNGNDVTFTVNGPALDFNPPEKVKQPTLYKGDKSKDGWVEYLQEALNHHLGTKLTVDGDFGPATLQAVIAFQTKHKKEGVLVDGIVGNQTWSFLREGVPEKPSTDGRKPHTYFEEGQEARWLREKDLVTFDAGRDALVMKLVSVGSADSMKDRKVRVRVTAPDKTQKVEDCPIGPPIKVSTTGQGSEHEVLVSGFSHLFDPQAAKAPSGDYLVEAYFDEELGGDKFAETITISP
jgi:hypothetical protein